MHVPFFGEITEEKRRKALQERRFAREQRIEQSLSRWEREIAPDWRVVLKNPALRKLWWQGIPTKLRATMWQSAVGNDLALSKGMGDTNPRKLYQQFVDQLLSPQCRCVQSLSSTSQSCPRSRHIPNDGTRLYRGRYPNNITFVALICPGKRSPLPRSQGHALCLGRRAVR